MNEPKTIKRLTVTSKELAEALGLPWPLEILKLNKEVVVEMKKHAYRSYEVPTYGETLTIEWEEK